MSRVNVSIVGATGAVGSEVLRILEERRFPVGRLRVIASGRSEGTDIPFQGRSHKVENLAKVDFAGTDLVLSAPGASVSREFAPKAVAAGAVVVDKSSAFRMLPEVPLVVPEVNADALAGHKGIIACPNCSTILLAVVLGPIHRAFGLRRVVVSTYQAVSGAGRKGMEELNRQTVALLTQRPLERSHFPHPIAFNLIPQIDTFRSDGYTGEEVKLIEETRKILGLPDLAITCTAVRVPVMNGHSESVNLACERPVTPEACREVLAAARGVSVQDDPAGKEYPMPMAASGRDEVFVGRIRKDPSQDNGVDLWLSGDNLRKGAALNSIQIAEVLFAN